mmetsp:Transcript_26301/g.44382  ORF Transcript_26301/g.44382 Transcript_26301/m.44382 type:complete len:154 (-) Transcript_26301:226-687(-)|eukprot:CAMPEP_0114417368 /NCGR_PEP_ID=MMETSP0103-20121206/2924_1 /TAXON_ID=37642 ORGANISM="Paraphysomonas imperforata, Strain PA2" /NCGR_SAMPLE_ID=MMETSP0103 /ASSEMBLY_ACC=CAM_ASM_000201 /LENGTH=153 /DNA_ID=CAMNT_0001585651 /DNA_START=27 /DNA_END=488 /DNA_ORIENTATION=+
MSRQFDHGKYAYGQEHRSYHGQNARHYLGNDMLEHYGANPNNYQEFSGSNYRMGNTRTNGRDTRLDNQIIGEVFSGFGSGYDAYGLTQRSASGHTGLSYQQQLDGVGARFDTAKAAYEATGEYKYYMIQKDLRDIAGEHLNGDMRQFRLSNRR